MAFDCGVFQKLKKTRQVQEPTKLPDDVIDPGYKENRVANFCRSPDWKEFEGAFASGTNSELI